MRTVLTVATLCFCSLALFLWRLDDPPYFFYDESQYVIAANALLTGETNPNPEAPPMGKLLVALSIRTFGDNPWGWRTIGAVFGSLTLGGVFLWARLLIEDYALALTAGLLTFLNNFLYVMSRVAMMDIFLVAFLMWGLVAFTAAVDLKKVNLLQRRLLLAASGISLGFACACKWNGIDTLGIVFLASIFLYSRGQRFSDERMRRSASVLRQIGFPAIIITLVLLPILAYALSFWPLCRSLHQPFNVSDLVSMNVFIWRFHRAVPGNPLIAAGWYSWLLQVSPQRALSYLVGNWAVMWGGLLACIVCLRKFGKSFPHTLLISLFVGNLLQWAVTPQKLLYYYYYFPAAMLLGICIAVALQDLPRQVCGVRLTIVCLIAATCVFLFCFPQMAHLQAPFDCAFGCWV